MIWCPKACLPACLRVCLPALLACPSACAPVVLSGHGPWVPCAVRFLGSSLSSGLFSESYNWPAICVSFLVTLRTLFPNGCAAEQPVLVQLVAKGQTWPCDRGRWTETVLKPLGASCARVRAQKFVCVRVWCGCVRQASQKSSHQVHHHNAGGCAMQPLLCFPEMRRLGTNPVRNPRT